MECAQYPRESKNLHDQIIKLQAGINQEAHMHTEARLPASKIFSKCGAFWDKMAAEVKDFHLHFVTTTYGESVLSGGIAECCNVVLMAMRDICK